MEGTRKGGGEAPFGDQGGFRPKSRMSSAFAFHWIRPKYFEYGSTAAESEVGRNRYQ